VPISELVFGALTQNGVVLRIAPPRAVAIELQVGAGVSTVGQRVFFLHDGRTNNLLTAIEQHASNGSEANQVIAQFNMLSTTDQQNILNFLRDL
jgi:CxxC motif-containing protein (DUF1111 family)